jgi:hypothetical protein
MEEDKYKIFKNYINFDKPFDFNEVSKLLDKNILESHIVLKEKLMLHAALDAVFKIAFVDQSKNLFFNNLKNHLDNSFNKNKYKSNIMLFLNFITGGQAAEHEDCTDVYILGLFGETMYIIEDNKFIVSPGDLLFIKKGILHRAIGLSPRIVASYGIYY